MLVALAAAVTQQQILMAIVLSIKVQAGNHTSQGKHGSSVDMVASGMS